MSAYSQEISVELLRVGPEMVKALTNEKIMVISVRPFPTSPERCFSRQYHIAALWDGVVESISCRLAQRRI